MHQRGDVVTGRGGTGVPGGIPDQGPEVLRQVQEGRAHGGRLSAQGHVHVTPALRIINQNLTKGREFASIWHGTDKGQRVKKKSQKFSRSQKYMVPRLMICLHCSSKDNSSTQDVCRDQLPYSDPVRTREVRLREQVV